MRRTKAISAVLLAALTLSGGGCAWLFASRAQCGETPKGVVELFLEGISPFNFELILKVILGGWHPLEVFGGGDRERGREIVQQLIVL